MAAPTYETLKQQVKLGKGQSLGFATGKGYYARNGAGGHPAAAAAPASDPLTPYSPAEIQARIASYTKMMPAPLTDSQVQSRAQQTIDPLIAALTSRAEAQSKAATGAIGGYANSAADKLGAYGDSAKHIYGDAAASQAASDAAESQAVRSGGSTLANELSAKLADIGAGPDATAAYADSQTTTGNGAANALLGTGSAALANILAQGATARDYAAKLPGLARADGMAAIRDTTLAGNKNLADNVSTVTQQLPGIVNSLRSDNETRSTNRANAAAQLGQYLESHNLDVAKFNKAEQDAGFNATTKANATVKAAQIKASDQAAKDAKPNASLSGKVGYLVDSNNNWIPGTDGKPQVLPGYEMKNGRVVKAVTPKAAAKASEYPSLTKAQVLHLRAGIASAFNGVPEHKDANGKVTQNALPPVSYQEAINHAISAGYSRAAAIRMANHFYMPGDRGRPGGKPDPVKTKIG